MVKTITYNRVEKITYTFNRGDIFNALASHFKISGIDHKTEINFDSDNEEITLVVNYVYEEKSKE